MSGAVYITRLSKFLPNGPVSNEEMEEFLGMIDGRPSRAKGLVLRNNQIKTRYYALDKEGNSTHSNTQLTAEAIRGLLDDDFTLDDMDLLACGTTSPDQLLPSHAAMVHGELKSRPVEIISMSGACCSGIQSLKYGYLSVLTGEAKNAVCTGSEKLSTWETVKNFQKEAEMLKKLESDPILAFEKDFLRWMLSDGAGAALLQDKPGKELSLKIDWIDSISYASKLETCMYAGGEKDKKGDVKGWKEFEADELLTKSLFSLRQDVKLLGENIVRSGVDFYVDLIKKRNLDFEKIDYFLPHLSSEFFRQKIADDIKNRGVEIPQEKWFTNLTRLGNVGAASIYFMMEELFHSGKLEKGNRILLMIPESARFSYVYGHLTVV
ncbi:MAG: beta-ketoacyl-ACP synthase III [Bacteroidales bacterium]|nr:MAG: beta-ketoacyl-ACP synthase III [Bacteroidales bacterium]